MCASFGPELSVESLPLSEMCDARAPHAGVKLLSIRDVLSLVKLLSIRDALSGGVVRVHNRP